MSHIKREEDAEGDDPIECTGVIPAPTGERDPGLKLRENDVLCARGRTVETDRPGNASYRLFINLNRPMFECADSLIEKSRICKSIVASIRHDGGRFLEREDESTIVKPLADGRWRDIGDGKAAEITLNSLMEGCRGRGKATAGTPSRSPPTPVPPKETKSTSNYDSLMRLTPEQSEKMKYPVGCPVWHTNGLDRSTPVSGEGRSDDYSSLGVFKVGCVKSVSIDIMRRNLLYEVVSSAGITGSKGAKDERGDEKAELILEEHLCYASKCPVQVQLIDGPVDGEVISCNFSDGLGCIAEKKSYTISAFSNNNEIHILQVVNEKIINFRKCSTKVESKQEEKVEPDVRDEENNAAGDKPKQSGAAHNLQKEIILTPEIKQPLEPANHPPQPGKPSKSHDTSSAINNDNALSSNCMDHGAAGINLDVQKSTCEVNADSAQHSAEAVESTPRPTMCNSFPPDGASYSIATERNSTVSQPPVSHPRFVPPSHNSHITLNSHPPKRPSLSSSADEILPENPHKYQKSSAGSPTVPWFRRNDYTDAKPERNNESMSEFAAQGSSPSANKIIEIPSWVVAHDSLCRKILDGINSSKERISQETQCAIQVDQRTMNGARRIFVKISCARVTNEANGIVRNAFEMVENIMVEKLGAGQLRGKLLYDTMRSYSNLQHDGAVLQRNPLNSSERTWMVAIDLPSELSDKNITPLLKSEFPDNIHRARCTFLIHTYNFNQKPLPRCDYLMILGKKSKDVADAIALTKRALRDCIQSAAYSVFTNQAKPRDDVSSSAIKPVESGPSMLTQTEPNLTWVEPRKISVPIWLLSDPLYLKEIEDGLFGNRWCEENNFQDRAACEIVFSQHCLLLKPSINTQLRPRLKVATQIIEDVLLGILGASESKCMLLYDLTRSYGNHPPGGFTLMRNPLTRCGLVWTNIIHLSCYKKTCMTALVKQGLNNQMHRLKCTLKICKECFGVAMNNCKPYVMVIGRQKNDVVQAIKVVRGYLEEYWQRTGEREDIRRGWW